MISAQSAQPTAEERVVAGRRLERNGEQLVVLLNRQSFSSVIYLQWLRVSVGKCP